jgi:hypothetical protein
MARRVLSLLLILPLLLPPGVCICDLLHRCEACTESPRPTSVVASPSRTTACHCCRHKHTGPVAQHQVAPCHDPVPADGKDPHAPGCPAKTGGSWWKTEPTVTATPDANSWCGMVAVLDAQRPPQVSWRLTAQFCPPDQSLYLALLNLRI